MGVEVVMVLWIDFVVNFCCEVLLGLIEMAGVLIIVGLIVVLVIVVG